MKDFEASAEFAGVAFNPRSTMSGHAASSIHSSANGSTSNCASCGGADVASSVLIRTPGASSWRSKPSWYAVSTQDRTIDSEQERFMAKRMNATTVELNSSHVSLLSHPQEVAGLIVEAAPGPGR